MISLLRTSSENSDFIELVKQLDTYLAVVDGADHSFYAQFNKIDKLKNVIVAFENGQPVGCGAFKAFSDESIEIKRMFVKEEARGKKIASLLLSELESWAKELGFNHFVLETGIRQSAAIALYQKTGYQTIPNYGQYAGIATSVCFEKRNS